MYLLHSLGINNMKKITQKRVPIIEGNFKPSMSDISVMLDWLEESTTLVAKRLRGKVEKQLFGLIDSYKHFKKLVDKHE